MDPRETPFCKALGCVDHTLICRICPVLTGARRGRRQQSWRFTLSAAQERDAARSKGVLLLRPLPFPGRP
jgi:hypothetical protein